MLGGLSGLSHNAFSFANKTRPGEPSSITNRKTAHGSPEWLTLLFLKKMSLSRPYARGRAVARLGSRWIKKMLPVAAVGSAVTALPAFDAAMRQAKRTLTQKFMDTPQRAVDQMVERRTPKRRIPGFGGSLGGKLRGRTKRTIWRKRKLKKATTVTLSKILHHRSGVMATRETGISTTGVQDAVYLGHHTFQRDLYVDIFSRVLFKEMMAKLGRVIYNWDDTGVMGTGDTLTFTYKENQASLTTISTVDVNYNAAHKNFNYAVDIASTMQNVFKTHKDAQAIDWSFNNATTKFTGKIDLTYSEVAIYVKSALKLQNASTSSAGGEADDVDNVPVNGRFYTGKGTLIPNNRQRRREEQFAFSSVNGLLKVVPTATSGLQDPPPPGYFYGVRGTGKSRINPGKIKTSVLSQQVRVNAAWLIKMIYSGDDSVNHAFTSVNIGKFAFYGFEHVIKASADAPNIKILGELNNDLAMMIVTKTRPITDISFGNNYATYANPV